MKENKTKPLIAIACGGTGGHLFPGLALAEEFLQRDCDVTLLISQKEVDQQAVKAVKGMEIVTLPAVGLTSGAVLSFFRNFFKSFSQARNHFKKRRPDAVISMGGFTSAAPVIAGDWLGSKVFLHDSNTIPGRANRWLAHIADEAFVYFHETSGRLYLQKIKTVGMPLRREFLEETDSESAKLVFNLDVKKPVLLVMGGSQGASGINDLVVRALPELKKQSPDLQFIHLTGTNDFEKVRAAYAAEKMKATVYPFLTEMELALSAATICISRAGASSLAEIAAMSVPSVLIPYPHAADDHQFHNALAFVETGAAKMFQQNSTTPERLAQEIVELAKNESARAEMKAALAQWHKPEAAQKIVDEILSVIGVTDGPREKIKGVAGNFPGTKLNLEKTYA